MFQCHERAVMSVLYLFCQFAVVTGVDVKWLKSSKDAQLLAILTARTDRPPAHRLDCQVASAKLAKIGKSEDAKDGVRDKFSSPSFSLQLSSIHVSKRGNLTTAHGLAQGPRAEKRKPDAGSLNGPLPGYAIATAHYSIGC
jgi:hypothetical protein